MTTKKMTWINNTEGEDDDDEDEEMAGTISGLVDGALLSVDWIFVRQLRSFRFFDPGCALDDVVAFIVG